MKMIVECNGCLKKNVKNFKLYLKNYKSVFYFIKKISLLTYNFKKNNFLFKFLASHFDLRLF